MDEFPFKDAAKEIVPKKKKKDKHKRKGIVCTCGAIKMYLTGWKAWHDPDCIINKGDTK